MALLTRKRVIAVLKESTAGTYNAPQAANCLLVRDLNITPQQSDVISRDLIRPYFGASEQLQANTRVECTFSVEMAGVGAGIDPDVAPNFGECLEACGFTMEATDDSKALFTPNSLDSTTVSILYNIDGVQHTVKGAKGTFSISCSVGEIPTFDFTFTGVYVPPGDANPLTPSYQKQATPLLFNNTNTGTFKIFGETGLQMSNFSLDIGNEVIYRELVGGDPEVMITNRNVTGSVTVEAVNLDSGSDAWQKTTERWDPFADALADGTLGEISFVHGTAALNKVTIQSGIVTSQATKNRVDLGSIGYSEEDGIAMWDCPFTMIPSTSGNDELSIIFE
tara:strand:+ start:794 stop:1801 length:1008 start_codon:yes stop_codon:yes gene_type:complete